MGSRRKRGCVGCSMYRRGSASPGRARTTATRKRRTERATGLRRLVVRRSRGASSQTWPAGALSSREQPSLRDLRRPVLGPSRQLGRGVLAHQPRRALVWLQAGAQPRSLRVRQRPSRLRPTRSPRAIAGGRHSGRRVHRSAAGTSSVHKAGAARGKSRRVLCPQRRRGARTPAGVAALPGWTMRRHQRSAVGRRRPAHT